MKTAPSPHPDKPAMPIGPVVSRLSEEFPDVTHSSLRFLEREGLLTPFRTPGGHRLYTEDDIARVAQIKRWQQQHLSLEEIRARLEEAERLPDLAEIARAFVEEGARGNFVAAARLVIGADDVGVPLVRIFGEVLLPAMVEVGNRWASGEMYVAQEKQFSEVAGELITELSRRHLATDPHITPIVAACVKGVRHQLGLRMLVGLLRAAGYRVHYLGADVDPQFLVEAVRLHHPKGILLSADLPERLPDVREAISALERTMGAGALPPVIVGGRGIRGSVDELQAWGLLPMVGDTIPEDLDAIRTTIPPTGQ